MRAPRKLSAAIRLGLADLAKVERSDKYEVDMSTWYRARGSKCAVCFAGAVMAKTLNAVPLEDDDDSVAWRDRFGTAWEGVIFALDAARQGFVGCAMSDMNPKKPHEPFFKLGDEYLKQFGYPPAYDEDPAGFRKSMRQMAKWLEARGL